MRVDVDVVTMLGSRYALFERDGAPGFPSGELGPGESAGDAVRRIVAEWTGTTDPKIELVDLLPRKEGVALVFRALLVGTPSKGHRTFDRMGLPPKAGRLDGPYVEDALKTSLSYKLTRPVK